jgi:hypothetical protein
MATKYVHQIALKIPNGHKAYQNFPSQDLKNVPKFGFLVCK